MLTALREVVCAMNRELPRAGLVKMTSGNVSGHDPATDLVVIKPSGMSFEALTPDAMVVVDLFGNIVEGQLKPSVDTATHLMVYRGRPDIHGIVHTHSNYATTFAALGRAIPAVLTAIADEFGGPIPCGPYCQIGEVQIGQAILDNIGLSPAILMQNHGVFAIGSSPLAAFRTAVMCEDVAKTAYLALLLGNPVPIPDEEIARGHRRYMDKYGQVER
jgi:L-ribulose-5-phosphate 4-epimerase